MPTTIDESVTDACSNDDDVSRLTPLRAHYLKKTLISLQFAKELSALTSPSSHPAVSPLSYLGFPFTPPPKDAPLLDFPFIRYVFRQFVLTFPFLAAAPKDFFPQKVQPFIASILARNLSAASPFDEEAEKTEQATRDKVISKIQKQFAILLGAATKIIETEEVVRLSQKDLQRLEALARRRQTRENKVRDIFNVNIISVRTVVDKGRVRSRAHEEFLIRTRRSDTPDVVVSRRYGDFKTLANELRKAYPNSFVPSPPNKDRSAVVAPPVPTPPIPSPISPPSLKAEAPPMLRIDTADSGVSFDGPPSAMGSVSAALLAREKNRLTLRSYLHTLMSSSIFINSPVLKSFLLSGPTELTPAEVEDARRREEADQTREEGRKRFAKELAAKVDGLRNAMKSVKGDIMGKDGLRHIFATIKETSDVRDLPADFRAVLEWARTSLASTIFHHYVTADTASESLASLKRIHGLIPYFVLKGILKISNPIGMIRGILDLFLAQPFGGRSLLQRMFTSSMVEEVRALQEDIEAVRDKVEDPILCEKIKLFVYAPPEIQAMFKADAAEEQFDIITIVLRSSEDPMLSRAQLQRVRRAHFAHMEYIRHRESLADSDDDDGPQNDDAWLFEDLTILGKLYSRLRDRQQLMELIFEGTTAELLKDIITIFYAPLAQVYKAASIADSLGDLQTFVNDLIRTVEQAEEVSQHDPTHTVNMFIELVQRHEQAFYNFVYKVHSKGAGLFESLMRWIELFLNVIREGVGQPISLEYLLPHTGQDRVNILHEIDAVARYHYRLKVAYESKLRRRFVRGNAAAAGNGDLSSTADEEDAATQALVDGVVKDFSFGDLVHGDAEDLVTEDEDSDDEDEEEEDEDEDEEDEDEDETTESEAEDTPGSDELRGPRRVPPSQSHTNAHANARSPMPPPQSVPTSGSQFELPPLSQAGGDGSGGSSTPIPRQRSRSWSLRSRKSAESLALRKTVMEAPPPVPPVPPIPVSPSPSRHSSHTNQSPMPASAHPVLRRQKTTSDLSGGADAHGRGHGPSASVPSAPRNPNAKMSSRGRNKKKQALEIKPPDLKAIPDLLPLFTEMMRSLLRPRPV